MTTDFMQELSTLVRQNNQIAPDLYSLYQVKRGLRDDNGAGVLVGLTEIGEVHGYVIDEGEPVPVPGRLLYRGYNLEDLVTAAFAEGRMGFEEIAFLLLFGQLPTVDQLTAFRKLLASYYELPGSLLEDNIMRTPSPDLMNKLAHSVLSLYAYDDNADDNSVENVVRQSIALLARMPVMASYGYQVKSHYYLGQSLVIHQIDPCLSHAENLLHLTRDNSEYTTLEAHALDVMMMIHAEHGGGNNSTFTTHVVSTTGTDTYSAVTAAICSLKGPRHGGATLAGARMMADLKASVEDWTDENAVRDYLKALLNGEAFDKSGLIYGFGHAVYTASDPRAVLLCDMAIKLAAEKGRNAEMDLYLLVERLVPEVFHEIKHTDQVISANVDYFSGFVYDILGIPSDLYAPLFAVSRVAGWCAHRLEEIIVGGKIMRPAYKSVVKHRNYVPLGERG